MFRAKLTPPVQLFWRSLAASGKWDLCKEDFESVLDNQCLWMYAMLLCGIEKQIYIKHDVHGAIKSSKISLTTWKYA